ncbi:transcription elongation factor GreAB [Marinomonas hwangdonensis]|uniref:Transcription elongation factor GreAB n=1 Tax=Marinomonas hwangdonensis TaxID=1053647 RepID=A0A3M8Q330_9GAMM|nr:transcription elongation factor GreAB [Marinomonas hwangdonensis]RNF50021.1 transcription elongation factor GreAB [Marinomonas hwangdonensis]
MNKHDVYEAVTAALLSRYETAKWAAKQAHDAATDEESVAENKYDTFGLEASYLAHGQSKRVLECENEWHCFNKKSPILFSEGNAVELWGLVSLVRANSKSAAEKHFFISPCAGGLSVEMTNQTVYLVTPSSPVGRTLISKYVGDEVELLQNGQVMRYEILNLV